MTEEILKNKIDIRPFFDETYIYFLIKDEKIIYVGQTNDLYGRISAHKKTKDFNYIYYEKTSKPLLNYMENYYILKYLPKYNKQLNASAYCFSFKDIQEYYYRKYIEKCTVYDIRKALCNIKTFSVIDGITRIYQSDLSKLVKRIYNNKNKRS